MGAFDATNTHNPLFSDPRTNRAANSISSPEKRTAGEFHALKGSAKGDTQL